MQQIVERGLKFDLHIHSSASAHKDGKKVKNNTVDNIPLLISKLNENEVEICSITDHDYLLEIVNRKMKKLTQYNKLVRDHIPEIIAAGGKTCTTEILSDADYLRMLDAKLDEELAEYHSDQNIEELADLLEVVRAVAVARGYTLDELERVRAEKAEKRGGFKKKIFLKTVEEG